METKQAARAMCALARGRMHLVLDEKGCMYCKSKDWVDCVVAMTLDAAFLAGCVVGFLAAVSLWVLIK